MEEFAFDTTKLASWAEHELKEHGVHVRLGTRVTAISHGPNGLLQTTLSPDHGSDALLNSQLVFNCTYSGLNQFKGDFPGTQTDLKHEITEMALVKVPPVLQDLGITVMDGPFFSMMPFPARGLHTLSHVRYTPHLHWKDQGGMDPYEKLASYEHDTRVDRMIRDVGRYLPCMHNAQYVDSLV